MNELIDSIKEWWASQDEVAHWVLISLGIGASSLILAGLFPWWIAVIVFSIGAWLIFPV